MHSVAVTQGCQGILPETPFWGLVNLEWRFAYLEKVVHDLCTHQGKINLVEHTLL